METLEQLKEIVKNAPDDATHVQIVEGENQYFESNGFGFWCLNSDCQVVAEDIVSVRSLSDIKRIIELMEAVKSLPDKLETDKWLEGLDRPTEFAISQAKSFAISSVFDSIRKAKKLL